MAITITNPYSQGSYSSLNTIATSSYTVAVGVDFLYIYVYADNGNVTAPLPDLVEWNSVAANLVSPIPTDAGGTGQLHFVYRIPSPVAGTGSLRVRHPSFMFGVAAACVSCDGTLTVTTGSYNYANNASASAIVASSSGNTTLFSLTVNNVDGSSVTETGSQTVLSEGGAAANAMHQLSRKTSSGATNSATWTIGASQRWSAIAINFHETSQTVVSINGGSSIEVGEAGVTASLTGYTGVPLSITTDLAGVACSNITGTASAPVFDVSGWVEAGLYPALPAVALFTFSRNTESSNASQTIIVPPAYTSQTFAGAIISDDTYVTEGLAAEGHTVEGAAFHYIPYGDLFIFADGKISATTDGTFTAWLRPESGATAGRMYSFEITIIDGAATVSGELTATGLTVTSPSVSGLTVTGL
jgi:VCBS repeat-containing protein